VKQRVCIGLSFLSIFDFDTVSLSSLLALRNHLLFRLCIKLPSAIIMVVGILQTTVKRIQHKWQCPEHHYADTGVKRKSSQIEEMDRGMVQASHLLVKHK
jgi:hypothetical protein